VAPNIDETADDDLGDLLAPITKRIGARLLDWVLLLIIWIPLAAATSERVDDSITNPWWARVLWMLVVVLYEVGFVSLRGQTPGKSALGIQVVALNDGHLLSLPAAIIRVLPVAFAMLVLQIFFPIAMVFVYFSAAFMTNSRGILDLMSGSVVIDSRR
jgi:uncharacterized RDD family membrane protein YckC